MRFTDMKLLLTKVLNGFTGISLRLYCGASWDKVRPLAINMRMYQSPIFILQADKKRKRKASHTYAQAPRTIRLLKSPSCTEWDEIHKEYGRLPQIYTQDYQKRLP